MIHTIFMQREREREEGDRRLVDDGRGEHDTESFFFVPPFFFPRKWVCVGRKDSEGEGCTRGVRILSGIRAMFTRRERILGHEEREKEEKTTCTCRARSSSLSLLWQGKAGMIG